MDIVLKYHPFIIIFAVVSAVYFAYALYTLANQPDKIKHQTRLDDIVIDENTTGERFPIHHIPHQQPERGPDSVFEYPEVANQFRRRFF